MIITVYALIRITGIPLLVFQIFVIAKLVKFLETMKFVKSRTEQGALNMYLTGEFFVIEDSISTETRYGIYNRFLVLYSSVVFNGIHI